VLNTVGQEGTDGGHSEHSKAQNRVGQEGTVNMAGNRHSEHMYRAGHRELRRVQ
jgi:hypothetical protein